MYERSRTWAISTLLVTFVLAGCGDDTVEGVPGACGDPVAIAGSVDRLLRPAEEVRSASTALRSAFEFLVDQGVTFDRASPGIAATRVIAGAVEIPAALLGETVIYDAAESVWVVDPERTGAPANGVRIIWYEADTAGNFIVPLVEKGYVDLTDEDDGTGSRIGIVMVSTANGVIADFTERLDSTTTATTVETDFTAAGFFSGGDETIDFQVDYSVSANTETSDSVFTIGVTLEGTEGVYTLAIDGTASGSDSPFSQDITAGMTQDGSTTTLNLDITGDAAGDQSGTGNIVCDGEVAVEIAVEGSNFRYSEPGGGALGSGAAADIDYLVGKLYVTGLDALTRLPLLFLGAAI
ncbi:MAG: hypothetical protein ACN0LA_11255 [Candidatus Longimicrobiales bacterium M2_2A_002]